MFWRTVVRNSDENTRITDEKPWERVVDMAVSTFRKLSTGASWSGNERNHLFMGGLEGHQFMRASAVSGLDDPGDSRAFATIDIDRDGWQDVLLGNVSAPRLRLLRNKFGERASSADNGLVAIRFVGGNDEPVGSSQWSSRDGLGARVVADLGDGRKLYREHRVDDGFKAQNSATMILGIGDVERLVSLTVRWPSGREQVAEDISEGGLVTFYEASPDGSPYTVEPYRRAPAEVVEAAEAALARKLGWKAQMSPAEPSGQVLKLPLPPDTAPAKLVLQLGMATTCAACAKEIPTLKEMRKSFDESELALVGIPCDPKDAPKDLEAWAERLSAPYAILTGITGEQRDAMLAVADALLYQNDVLPYSVVTDADGKVLLATWGLVVTSWLLPVSLG